MDAYMLTHPALALAVTTTCGCGQLEKRPLPAPFVDDRLGALLAAFVEEAGASDRTVSAEALQRLRVVRFVDDVDAELQRYPEDAAISHDAVGVCAEFRLDDTIGIGAAQMAVDQRRWQEIWIESATFQTDASAQALKELVFHELGHCLFGLTHAAQSPHSIMSPRIEGDSTWLTANWGRLSQAFFAKIAPTD